MAMLGHQLSLEDATAFVDGTTCQVPKQMLLRTKAGWDTDECVRPPFEDLPEPPPRVLAPSPAPSPRPLVHR